jgi:hypothetical protein
VIEGRHEPIAVSGLEPLLDGGILRMTVPDKPTSSKQRYVLTDAGLKLKSLRLDYGKVSTKKEESEWRLTIGVEGATPSPGRAPRVAHRRDW